MFFEMISYKKNRDKKYTKKEIDMFFERMHLAFLRSLSVQNLFVKITENIPYLFSINVQWGWRELTALYLLHRSFSMHLKEPQEIISIDKLPHDDVVDCEDISRGIITGLLDGYKMKATEQSCAGGFDVIFTDVKTGREKHKAFVGTKNQHLFAKVIIWCITPRIILKHYSSVNIEEEFTAKILKDIGALVKDVEGRAAFSTLTFRP